MNTTFDVQKVNGYLEVIRVEDGIAVEIVAGANIALTPEQAKHTALGFIRRQQSAEYVTWEEEVTDHIQQMLEVDRSEAAEIVAAQPFVLTCAWGVRLEADNTAQRIIVEPAVCKILDEISNGKPYSYPGTFAKNRTWTIEAVFSNGKQRFVLSCNQLKKKEVLARWQVLNVLYNNLMN